MALAEAKNCIMQQLDLSNCFVTNETMTSVTL